MNVNSLDFSTAIEEVTYLMGLNPLKPKQTESLCAFVSGKDTFVTLPTGYDKSVVFAVLPLLFDKLLGRSYSPQHVDITVLIMRNVCTLLRCARNHSCGGYSFDCFNDRSKRQVI